MSRALTPSGQKRQARMEYADYPSSLVYVEERPNQRCRRQPTTAASALDVRRGLVAPILTVGSAVWTAEAMARVSWHRMAPGGLPGIYG